MRKKVCIIMSILLIGVAIMGVSYYVKAVNTKVVERGVEKDYAVEKCEQDSKYHIVKFSGANTGLMYVIAYGEDKGVEVELL